MLCQVSAGSTRLFPHHWPLALLGCPSPPPAALCSSLYQPGHLGFPSLWPPGASRLPTCSCFGGGSQACVCVEQGFSVDLQLGNLLKFQGENKVHPQTAAPPVTPAACSLQAPGLVPRLPEEVPADLSLPAGAAVPGGHDGEGLLHHDRTLPLPAGRQVRARA